MHSLEIPEMEAILETLDDGEQIFPQYQLHKKESKPVLLGKGGFSYIYEMVKRNEPYKHYALKVMGFNRHTMSEHAFCKTVDLQRMLSGQSEHVARIIDAKSVEIVLDEDGKFLDVKDSFKEGDAEHPGELLLQFILMEKLEPILGRDRFGNVSLLEKDLCTEEAVIDFAKQIGEAIAVAHGNNVLHRDIKLENIFWNPGTKKYQLGDFGIAKYVESGTAETMVYTDGYGAPEIERRLTGKYSAAADIYSFGVTLYLLLNELCFPASEGYRVNPVQYSPGYIFPAPKGASPLLTGIVQNMCCYHYEDRYATVEEVLADFEKLNEAVVESVEEVEYPDLETETYRDSILKKKSKHKEEPDETSRAFRKALSQVEKQHYMNASSVMMILMAICIIFYLKLMGTNTDSVSHPLFWLMPVALLIQAILCKIKEFHWMFGVIVLGLTVYSAVALGCGTAHVIVLVALLSGLPVLMTAGAIGIGLWLLWEMSGLLADAAIFQNGHLAWIVLTVLLLLINDYIWLGWFYDRRSEKAVDRWFDVYEISHKVLIVIGIIAGILQLTGVFVMPHPWNLIHPGLVGLVLLIITNLQPVIQKILYKIKDSFVGDEQDEEEDEIA